MSTTAEKLNKLLNTKAAIASALEEVGQEGGTVFSTYADQIRNIPAKVGSLCVNMTPAESPDPEMTVFEADVTYEQVLETYASGRFVYANVPLGDAYVVAPIMLSQDGQIGFGAYTGDSFLMLIMGQDSENLAIMQTIEMTEQLGISEHFGNENNPHNVTAAQVGAVATGDFSSLLETELQDTPNITMGADGTINIGTFGESKFIEINTEYGITVRTGGGVTGIYSNGIEFTSNRGVIKCLADPTDDNDAANKAYVDSKSRPVVTTEGTGAAFTATVPGITSLTAGASFLMVPHTASTSKTATLNVNGLGAKSLKRHTSNVSSTLANGYADSWLSAGTPVEVIYNGTYWIVQGMTQTNPHDLSTAVPITKGGTGVTAIADTTYTTARYRASALFEEGSETDPTTNGVIHWTYA